jgi:hypothetical protein
MVLPDPTIAATLAGPIESQVDIAINKTAKKDEVVLLIIFLLRAV